MVRLTPEILISPKNSNSHKKQIGPLGCLCQVTVANHPNLATRFIHRRTVAKIPTRQKGFFQSICEFRSHCSSWACDREAPPPIDRSAIGFVRALLSDSLGNSPTPFPELRFCAIPASSHPISIQIFVVPFLDPQSVLPVLDNGPLELRPHSRSPKRKGIKNTILHYMRLESLLCSLSVVYFSAEIFSCTFLVRAYLCVGCGNTVGILL